MRRIYFFGLLSLLVFSSVVGAEESANRIYVQSAEYGPFYAKCIPDELYGSKGKTLIYEVQRDSDKLVQSYDWYARQIFLLGLTSTGEIYVVRLGSWPKGERASDNDVAIAFYKNAETLKQHSTLDIAGQEDNVKKSKSHYAIFKPDVAIRYKLSDQFTAKFDAQTFDGTQLSFSITTGELISKILKDQDNEKPLE